MGETAQFAAIASQEAAAELSGLLANLSLFELLAGFAGLLLVSAYTVSFGYTVYERYFR